MIRSFPKVFAIGTKYISDIFNGEVEVSEKIDGSQFNFGKTMDGVLWFKSRNKQLFIEDPQMFSLAIQHVLKIKEQIGYGVAYHCEYLMKPKHNTICYGRVPHNNLIMFGCSRDDGSFIGNYEAWAEAIEIESVPIFFKGKIESIEELKLLLERESVLGNSKVEGIVIKNYNRPCWVGNVVSEITCGKYVSEAFKEKHIHEWKLNTNKGQLETLIESYRAEGRWVKAIQHLKEKGELTEEPKDIGPLIKEVHNDVEGEDKEEIKEALWKIFKKEIMNKSTAGLPEWYKERIAQECFNVNEQRSAGEILPPQAV